VLGCLLLAVITVQGQLIALLAAQNAGLAARVAQLEAANADLSERLVRVERAAPRNSGNSSMPPSPATGTPSAATSPPPPSTAPAS
jgi:cell division protein FtsB